MKFRPSRLLSQVVLSLTVAAVLSHLLASPEFAQDRPDIIWMRGGHTLDVRSMDYSPDGQLFVTMGDGPGVIKVWRVSDGVLLRTINAFTGFAYAVKFLPDNQSVVATGLDSSGGISTAYIRRIRVSDGQLIWSQYGGGNGIRLQITAGGDIFTSGNGAKFYRSSDGALLNSFNAVFYRNSNGTKTNWLGFSDGYLANNGTVAVSLGTGSGNYFPVIVDPNDCYVDTNGGKYCNVVAYFPSLSYGVSGITPDGSQILTYGGADVSKIYSVSDACSFVGSCPNTTISPIATITGDHNGNPTFSSDGQLLGIHTLTVANGNTFNVYSVPAWSLSFSKPHPNSYNATVFSPNNQVVANSFNATGAAYLGQVNFWRVSDGTLNGVLNSNIGGVNAAAFSPDNSLFASADGRSSQSDRVVHIWRTSDGSLLTSFIGDDSSVNSIAFSPNGAYIATGGDRSIKLWNLSDGSFVKTFGTNANAFSIAFSPDGTKLLTAGNSSPQINLWDIQSGLSVKSFTNSTYGRSVAISPDGLTIAASANSSFSSSISFWNINGDPLGSVLTEGNVVSLAFSPDSLSIVAGLEEGSGDRTSRVRQWRVSDRSWIRDYVGHINWVESVAFSPDGNTIMSGGVDGIRIWDATTGAQLKYFSDETVVSPATPTSGQYNVLSVAFSPDGSKFGYGRFDATAVVARNPFAPAVGRPVADFSANPNPAACGQSITFDGSGSYTTDPSSSIVSWQWDFGDGSAAASGMTTSHTYSQFGSYTAELTVTDNANQTSTAAKTININLGNHVPTAMPGGPYYVVTGNSATFDGSASTDLDVACGDNIASYIWTIDGVEVGQGAQLSLSPNALNTFGLGRHTLGLTVADTFGGTGTATTSLTIKSRPTITVVTSGDPDWHAFEPNGTSANITSAEPRSGNGSLELDGNSAYILSKGSLGTYGALDTLSFEWKIRNFTDPYLGTRSLPPDVALRVYDYGDPRTFFLHWDTCSSAVPSCDPRPVGSWQWTDLMGRLSIQQAEGHVPPVSLADIPPDAPITELHVRGNYSFGGPWHGFVDNVTLGFDGQNATTYNFELAAPVSNTQLYQINVLATYLVTNQDPLAQPAIPIPLSSLGVRPGDPITLQSLGDFTFCAGSCPEQSWELAGLFSSTSDVSGALPAIGSWHYTSPPTLFGNIPTDIPQQFGINKAPNSPTTVVVPDGAQYLFVIIPDSYYSDNADADGNFAVSITTPFDRTPPNTNATFSPTPNASGWHNSDMTVTLAAADNFGGSGVKEISFTLTGAQTGSGTVSGDTANIQITAEGQTTISFFATDNAGNTETQHTVLIKLDKSTPAVTCGTADGIWHSADVSIGCTAGDNISGLSNAADATFVLSTNIPSDSETADAQTGSRTVCDVAGNCTSAGPIGGNRIDKLAPSIGYNTPFQGAAYLLNSAVAALYVCSDSGSGLASCTGTTANGANIDTSSLGQKSFVINAQDNVGNTRSITVTYYVKASTTTKITSSLNPSTYGSTVTIMANVNSPNGTPVGSVQFFDGPTLLGAGSLSSGKARLNISSLGVGSHTITAVYAGGDIFFSSSSPAFTQQVNAAPTSTTLTSSTNPSNLFGSSIFTAQVTAPGANGIVPDGYVVFYIEGLGGRERIPLDSSGKAVLGYYFNIAGQYKVVAAYEGTTNFAASQASVNQVVKKR